MSAAESRAGRVQQWRTRHLHRLERARTDLDRIGISADHLRLALKHAEPGRRRQIVKSVCAELDRTADGLLTRYEKEGDRR